jgi:hypothetical protein
MNVIRETLTQGVTKVSNTKVVSNTLIYLQEFFHNILRSLSMFPKFLSTSTLNRKYFWEKEKPFLLRGPDPPANRPDSRKQRHALVSICVPLLCGPARQCFPPLLYVDPSVRGKITNRTNHTRACTHHHDSGSFPRPSHRFSSPVRCRCAAACSHARCLPAPAAAPMSLHHRCTTAGHHNARDKRLIDKPCTVRRHLPHAGVDPLPYVNATWRVFTAWPPLRRI